jgi:hypothetical protein
MLMQRRTAGEVLRPRRLMGGQRQVLCRAELNNMAKFSSRSYLDKAAQRFIVGACPWRVCTSPSIPVSAWRAICRPPMLPLQALRTGWTRMSWWPLSWVPTACRS